MVQDLEKAKDVVQECFLRLTKQPYDKIVDYVPAWLYTVCRNLTLKAISKRGRYTFISSDELDSKEAEDKSPDIALSEKEESVADRDKLKKALDKLKPKYRQVIELRFFRNMSYKDIAVTTGLTEGFVGFILCTEIKHLRKEYEKLCT